MEQYGPGIVAALGALTVFMLLYAIFSPFKEFKRDEIKDEFFGNSLEETPEGLGKYARPLINNFMPQFPTMRLDEKRKKNLNDFLLKSGNPWKLTAEEYSSMKFIFGGIGFFVGLILTVFELIPVIPWWAVLLLITGICATLPYSIYNTSKERRAKDAQKQLPEALDLLVVTLTSGKTFEGALNQVVDQIPPGIIREEMSKVNLKIKAGISLDRALTTLSSEIDSNEIESFTKAIIQGQKLGADITETLTNQAHFARDAHQARVEKMIARLSTTMFIPLVATMLPAFIIIFVAPALQQMSSIL